MLPESCGRSLSRLLWEAMGVIGLRRLRLAAVSASCAFVGGLVFSGAPASALVAHAYQYSFNTVSSPGSMAVDESTHDVYVIDQVGKTLDKLNALGEPVEFSALHSSRIEGVSALQIAVDNSSGPTKGDIYVAQGEAGPLLIYGSDGAFLGSLGETTVLSVAVGTSGAVYMVEPGEDKYPVINKYTPSPGQNPVTQGDLVSRLPGIGAGEDIGNIAVDSTGSVYVQHIFYTEIVDKYAATGFGEPAPTGILFTNKGKTLAVDQANDSLLVDSGADVVEYDSTGAQVAERFDGENLPEGGSVAVAVDGTTGQVYVANGNHGAVDVFSRLVTLPDISVGSPTNVAETSATLNGTVDPDGVDASCKVEYGSTASYGSAVPCSPSDAGAGGAPVAVSAGLVGLEPATVYHYRFVTTSENGIEHGSDHTFTSAALPVIDGEQVLSVGSESATVQAQINPRLQHVSYHFEYGTNTAYGASAPVPDSKIAVAEGDQAASWTLSGLQRGVSYHFRVVATDALGTVYGSDRVLTTYPRVVAGEACPNATIRQQQFSSSLPDCRAWEMVSPVEKNGVSIGNYGPLQQSSVDGDAIKYYASSGFGGTYGSDYPGGEYISRRQADGWKFHPINPEQGGVHDSLARGPFYEALSDDLSKGVFYALTPVVAGHPNVEQVSNLYLRTDVLSPSAGDYELLTDSIGALPPRPMPTTDKGVAFAGASSDFSHVVFEDASDITPEAKGLSTELPKLYEWDEGTERLVGILPDGTPAESSIAGRGAGGGPTAVRSSYKMISVNWTLHSISSDGKRVVFAGPPYHMFHSSLTQEWGGNIYMRIDHERTIQLNVSERSKPEAEEASPAYYWGATPDDSKVFFTSENKLLDGAEGKGAYVYMYDVNAPAGKHLTLISVDREPRDGTGCRELSLPADGISENGEYVYFLTGCELAPGQPRLNQDEGLYVWHNGTVRLVVEHAHGDTGWGDFNPVTRTAFRITPDGRHAVFVSRAPATAERAGVSIGSAQQVFVYSYDGDRVSCASCAPTGAASSSEAGFVNYLLGTVSAYTEYLNRPIGADGRDVFFDTGDALVAQDTNGKRDVYEYDTATGKVHLISGGTCNCDSLFMDAGVDGRNVFFTTYQKLVGSDIDNSNDIYDARVEGGLPGQNQAAAPSCSGEACQLAAEGAPDLSAPASSTFSGIGNVTFVPGPAVKPASLPKGKKPKHKRSKHGKPKPKRKRRAGRGRKSSNQGPHRTGR
ncbi:MAG TPA: hypothetical protein VGI76_00485 [Solirubrobacteraceae bacterium]